MVVVLAEDRIDVDDRRQRAGRGVLEELAARVGLGVAESPDAAGAIVGPRSSW